MIKGLREPQSLGCRRTAVFLRVYLRSSTLTPRSPTPLPSDSDFVSTIVPQIPEETTPLPAPSKWTKRKRHEARFSQGGDLPGIPASSSPIRPAPSGSCPCPFPRIFLLPAEGTLRIRTFEADHLQAGKYVLEELPAV
jgi:hypothetical protein